MGNCVQVQLDEIEVNEVSKGIKYPKLIIKKGNNTFHYVCNIAEWNYYLGRYYPKAVLIMICEHLKYKL